MMLLPLSKVDGLDANSVTIHLQIILTDHSALRFEVHCEFILDNRSQINGRY